MSVASGEGSLWETAVAILMLRHCIEIVNAELSRGKKLGALGGLGDLGIYSETIKRSIRKKTCGTGQGREVERPDAAQVRSHRVPPPADRTGARKQKRSFLLEGARDARAGWQQLGGGTEAIAECPQLLAWLF